MAQPLWLQGVVTVAVGALSGGLTNAVAVWMLFHPYASRGVGPFRIQGAIPKNRERMAKSLGKTVGERLLPEEDIARQLAAPGLREAFNRAVAGFLNRALNTPRGSLRDELPPALTAELERSLEPLALVLARSLGEFVSGPGFEEAFARHVALERWVADGVSRPELERAVRDFLTAQRARLLRDERPLIERLPAGLVTAVEQGVSDYLPMAVERLGALVADPEARERIRGALKKFLDRAVHNLVLHERVMAKLVITESRIDRLLAGLEGEGLTDLVEVVQSPDFRGQVARAVNDAFVRFLRTPLADRLWALGPDRLDALEQSAADYILAAIRAPETRAWAVARAREAVQLGRRALADPKGRERIAEVAQAAVRALLDRPLGRPADLLPADAEPRLRATLTEPLWSWIQRQVPVIVSQLSVREMVEQKVMGFSVERLEELIKRVIERELRTIVYLGYLLGAIVGSVVFVLGLLWR